MEIEVDDLAMREAQFLGRRRKPKRHRLVKKSKMQRCLPDCDMLILKNTNSSDLIDLSETLTANEGN